MDLVNIIYKYVNRFINCKELIIELNKLDLTKFSKEEQQEIKKLILDVQSIIDNTPNETDDIEKSRIANINNLLDKFEKILKDGKLEPKAKAFLEERYNGLTKEKAIERDGGRLYNNICELLTNNSMYKHYVDQMNDLEFLDFITQYISAPVVPRIDQEIFDDLVASGIKEDKREALWRLAFNYNRRGKDFVLIEDYFIEKRDAYYLTELVSAVHEDLDLDRLVNKVIDTKDKKFLNDIVSKGAYLKDYFNEEAIVKLKNSIK
jgi:hypothetical protein